MTEASTGIDVVFDANEKKSNISRRQLVKAGVWAAPVVVLATASPAAAVSVTSVSLSAVRGTGNSWDLTLTVNGTTSPTAQTVVVTEAPAGGVTWATSFPTSVTTAGNYPGALHVSGNSTYTIFVTVGGVQSNSVQVSKK